MFNKILTSLSIVMLATNALAGGDTNIGWLSQFDVFGVSLSPNTCGEHLIKDLKSCIGWSAGTQCDNQSHQVRSDFLAYGVLMMVAVDIKANGARFCPVVVESMQKKNADGWDGNTWTTYTSQALESGGTDCVWLCASGYTGEGCEQPDSAASGCDMTKLTRDNYKNYSVCVGCTNIENKIDMIQRAVYEKCGTNTKKTEHDTLIMINGWLPSGNGAFVRPMVVRAAHYGHPNCYNLPDDHCTGGKSRMFRSYPNIYPVAKSNVLLWCKNGYKLNEAKNDCVPIDTAICDIERCKKVASDFNDAEHTVISVSKDACTFRCTEPEQALTSLTDRTCKECKTTLTQGVSSENYTCITCPQGTIYSMGGCDKAYMLNGNDLQYGHGKTKNSQQDISKQCWTMKDMDDFRDCVLGAIKQ